MTSSVDTPAGGSGHRFTGRLPPELAACPEYDVIRELGRGGMGAVYLARNRLVGRLEALKVMTAPHSVGLFLREIHAAGRLNHPNVAAVYTALRVGGGLVLAMEYVDGQDMRRLVETRGPMSVPLASECVRQVALGLQHALDRGIVHRDVKPGNLIAVRTPGGVEVKILDFGLAGVVGVGDEDAPLGTPAFAAPEQMADPTRADTRSDIYALGGTLYFLLTGRQPFASPSSTEVMRRHRDESPRPLAELLPTAPPAFCAVVARMMAKDPADRFASPAEVAAALAPFADPLAPAVPAARPLPTEWPDTVAGEAPTTISNPPAPARRSRRLILGLVALAAACLAAAVAIPFTGRHGRTAEVTPPPAPPEPQFVPLFDGETLAGWVVDGGPRGAWKVENGALVTNGAKGGPRTWLLTEKDYGDCRLRFEYKLEGGGNSGVAFRAVPGELPPKPASGVYHQQIELSDDADPLKTWANYPTGQVNGAYTTNGPSLKPKKLDPPPPADVWHRMEVEFRGQVVRVRLNGDEINVADLETLIKAGSPCPALKRKQGRLGFQQHVKTASFRNVSVLELSPAK